MNELIPTVCPYCGCELKYDGINIMCTNHSCPGIAESYMVSCVNILGVKGFGPAMVSELVTSGGWLSFFDIFSRNKRNEFQSKIKVTANVEKVFSAISEIREIPLYKIIMLMGYDGMGETTAVQVARYISGLDYSFFGLDKDSYKWFGPAEVRRVEVQNVIKYLRSCSVEVTLPEDSKITGDFVGVEFTGSPKPYFNTKEDFLREITKMGYKHVKISEASILVTDSLDSSSSKMTTAKKKGIEIITYGDFLTKK